MYDFLNDLDEYFCEKYANYDKLCVLPGYKMPVMQATKPDEYGRTYAYTLPAETMRLATQENKAAILAELKARLTDATFSFSFQPLGFFAKIKNKLSKYGFPKNFALVLKKYGLTLQTAKAGLSVSDEIWSNICKGNFLPTKNLLFSLALTAQISFEDTQALLTLCGESFNFEMQKDVVASYLLNAKMYNPEMVKTALASYGIENLFIK